MPPETPVPARPVNATPIPAPTAKYSETPGVNDVIKYIMSHPFKSIVLIGAGGSIGKYVLEALLAEPSLTITHVQRASSKYQAPYKVQTRTVPDDYPVDALAEAFKGHDVVINCISNPDLVEQKRFVDAAVAAGIRRYVPSEYGLNNADKNSQALNAIFQTKGAVQAYLRSLEDRMEWMSISCGMWLKWSMAADFLGIHVREKRFVFYDEGEGIFSTTTEENTALGLVRALVRMPEETRNRTVFVSDFAVSQRQILSELERQTGETFVVEKVHSDDFIREKQEAFKKGDAAATYALIDVGFASGKFSAHLEKEGEIMNEKLGLPRKSLQEVVAAALAAVDLL